MTDPNSPGPLGAPAGAQGTPDANQVAEVPPLAAEPGSGSEPSKDEEESSIEGSQSGSEGELAGSGIGDAPTGVPREAL